jgi:hypothetical protein
MKIDSASINFQASHQSSTYRETSETLRMWNGNRRTESNATAMTGSRINISQSAQLALSMDSRARTAPPSIPAATISQSTNDLTSAIDAANEAVDNDPFLSMIRSMIEMLTGQPVKIFSSADLSRIGENSPPVSPSSDSPVNRENANTRAAQANFGAEYERHTVHEESETTNFSASGVIRTQDGQEIQFKLDLQMERSYREESHVSLRYGNAVARKDPLVINFAGNAAQLLDQHFRFDLNNDGQAEELPMLGSGSGYLAFDRNGNGQIDSGSELFGPATDNGFAELAELDADGNGWIDENDPMFSRLGIWRPSADPADPPDFQLSSLKDNGIGALGLTQLATPFELRGAGNSNLGAVRTTGIALTEDGRVLSLQEIDLTVS